MTEDYSPELPVDKPKPKKTTAEMRADCVDMLTEISQGSDKVKEDIVRQCSRFQNKEGLYLPTERTVRKRTRREEIIRDNINEV